MHLQNRELFIIYRMLANNHFRLSVYDANTAERIALHEARSRPLLDRVAKLYGVALPAGRASYDELQPLVRYYNRVYPAPLSKGETPDRWVAILDHKKMVQYYKVNVILEGTAHIFIPDELIGGCVA